MARSVNASPYFGKKLVVPSLMQMGGDRGDASVQKPRTRMRGSLLDEHVQLPSFSSSLAVDHLDLSCSAPSSPLAGSQSGEEQTPIEFTSPRTVQGGLTSDVMDLGSAFSIGGEDRNEAGGIEGEGRQQRPKSSPSSRLCQSTLLASLVRATREDQDKGRRSETEETKKEKDAKNEIEAKKAAIPQSLPSLDDFADRDIVQFVCQADGNDSKNSRVRRDAVKEKVEQTLRGLEITPDETLLRLLNGILALGGVRYALTPTDLQASDPNVIVGPVLADSRQLCGAPCGNLLRNKAALGRLVALFRGMGVFGLAVEPVLQAVQLRLLPWLLTLSAAGLRALRMAAAVAGLALLVGGSECAHGLQRAAESTRLLSKRAAPSSARIAACERCLQALFEAIFVQRYRDICEDVRAHALHSLMQCMQAYPAVFVDNAFLRYVGWALTDPSARVRLEALAALLRLIGQAPPALLLSFAQRFQQRLMQVVQRDRGNRMRALAVLDAAVAKGLVTASLVPLLQSLVGGLLGSVDDWRKCANVVAAAKGKGDLLALVRSLLQPADWRTWERGMALFGKAFPRDFDPEREVDALGIYWLAAEDRELLARIVSLPEAPEFALVHAARLVAGAGDKVDEQFAAELYRACAKRSAEACKLLVPVLPEHAARSLMAALCANATAGTPVRDNCPGILALTAVVPPPAVIADDWNVDDTAALQIEYRRVLWMARDRALGADDLVGLFARLCVVLEDTSAPADRLGIVAGMWADLLVLSSKKIGREGKVVKLPLEEHQLDGLVRRVHGVESAERDVALAVGKLQLADLLSAQAALRALCALAGRFAEHIELLALACEHFFADGTLSLAHKLAFARGVLSVRPEPSLARAMLVAIRTALQLQTDDSAVRAFVLHVARSAPTELWAVVASSFLLKGNAELRAECVGVRPAGKSKGSGASRKRRSDSAVDEALPAASTSDAVDDIQTDRAVYQVSTLD